MLIDPATLFGLPLMLRRNAPDDYTVSVGERTVGRIMLKPVSGGASVWFWTVTGPYLPPELQPSGGDEASLEEAKAALKAKFGAWLHHAQRKGEGWWHEGAGRVGAP